MLSMVPVEPHRDERHSGDLVIRDSVNWRAEYLPAHAPAPGLQAQMPNGVMLLDPNIFCYRSNFYGEDHQTLLGKDSKLGDIAITIRHQNTASSQRKGGEYLVSVRSEKVIKASGVDGGVVPWHSCLLCVVLWNNLLYVLRYLARDTAPSDSSESPLSIGICHCDHFNDKCTADKILRVADQAMYAGKRHGKNRINAGLLSS